MLLLSGMARFAGRMLPALPLLFSSLYAQTSTTSTVLGEVTDSTGAVVVGAQVSLVDKSTNQARQVITNESGQYIFVSVLPGNYRINVQAPGFRVYSLQDLQVDVSKSYQVNARMEVGQVAETVEVTAGASAELQTLDSTVGAVLKGESMLRMTTINRSAAELLSLQPMVSPVRGVGVNAGGQVAGARSDQNQFNLDGADATDLTSGTAGYFASAVDSAGPTPSVPVPLESVEEFRVSTTNPNASFGRSAGGQVSLVTKRGTNTIHGSAYNYLQNDNLNANTWTSNRLGIARPEKKDNRFGVSAGGPIIKNKTFIFGHYEGRRLPRGVLVTRIVPSETLKQGILRFADTTGAVQSYPILSLDPRKLGMSPVTRALWAKMPVGNEPTVGDGLNTIGFAGVANATQRMDFGVARIDHIFSSNWRINSTYRYAKQTVADTTQIDIAGLTGGGGGVKTAAVIPVEPRFWSMQLSGNLKPTMINELNLGYLRGFWAYHRLRAFPQVPGTAAAVLPGFAGAGVHAGIDFDTQAGRSRTWRDQTYQLNDNFTWIKGKHTFQMGGSIRRMPVFHERDDKVIGSLTTLVYELDAFNVATITSAARPAAVRSADATRFNSLFGAATGMVDKAGVIQVRDPQLNPLPIGTPMRVYARFNAYEMFGQDVWRVNSSLTVTLGLNYSIQTPPLDDNGLQQIMEDSSTGQTIALPQFLPQRVAAAQAGNVFNPTFAFRPLRQSSRKYIYDIDYNNFGPRIAAAWNPNFDSGLLGKVFGARKGVARVGYGVTFDRVNGVGVIMLPVMGPAFTLTVNCTGPRITGQCAGSSDESNAFRIGVDGSSVPIAFPGKPNSPVIPTRLQESLSFGIDPKMQIGKSHSVNLTFQRELPGGMLMELGYVARISNQLPQNFELNSVPFMMKDNASGQTFAQAYDAVANQLRSGVQAANVTPQPWFENQLRGNPVCVPNCTVYLANTQSTRFIQGELNPMFNTISDLRPAGGIYNRQIQNIHIRGSIGEAFYNAGFIQLQKRFKSGLSLNGSYTFSKALDTYGLNQESIGQLSTPYDHNVDWGPALFDRRHIFNSAWFYELPFGKGKKFNFNPVMNHVAGGWYVSGIFAGASGLPLGIGQSGRTFGGAQLYTGFAAGMFNNGTAVDYSTTVNTGVTGSGGIGTLAGGRGSGRNIFANPQAVYNSVRYIQLSQDGRHKRDLLRGMKRFNLDMSLGKKTKVGERFMVVFSVDALNLPNRVEFSDPSTSYFNPAAFGVISGQFNRPREVQFGLRVEF